ncbi:unnamed protein product [Phytophthora fragariaefolia]|uniref:Unnamed protein product n=1 Tax=Phytophthora fragariaefolia TaxID=1490495 RepID=A0A9W6XM23_9STRA|nr:unnamed protein product [Phytophthora fragariaefolia]
MYCVENSADIVGKDCGGGDQRADDFRPGQLDDPNEDADRKAWISVVGAAIAIYSSGGHDLPVPETSVDESDSGSRRCPGVEAHATATLCTVCKEDSQCYKTVTHPASIPPVRLPVGTAAWGSTTTNAVDPQSPASLRAASHSSVRPKKAVTTKKAGASINSQANTSKTSANSYSTGSLPNAAPTKATSKPRVGKEKAQQAPCKPKVKKTTTTNAAALQNELSRRLQATARNFVSATVAFAPPNEDWMDPEQYSSVGAAFLVGVVTRFAITSAKMLTMCACRQHCLKFGGLILYSRRRNTSIKLMKA